MPKPLPLLVFAVFIQFCVLARGQTASLDLRNIISELSLAVQFAEEALEPVLLVDKIPAWEKLVDSAASAHRTVELSLAKTDEAIASLRKSAERYSDNLPRKVAYQDRIELLESQAETLFSLAGQMGESAEKLRVILDKINNDPDVKAALESQALNDRINKVLQRADEAVPALLKE